MAAVQEVRRRVGDLREALSVYIKADAEDGTLTAENLTGKTITFTMINMADGTTKVSAASATIDEAATGKASYDFASADVDTAGKYSASFIVTKSTETSHFPEGAQSLIVLIDSDTQTAEAAYDAAVLAAG